MSAAMRAVRRASRIAVIVGVATGTSMAVPAEATAQELSLTDATIADLNRAFDAGTLSAEALVEMYLARIDAYDQRGPALNTVLWLNEEALERARALDAERASTGPRSSLHGIPVVLKDNVDTSDMPTTAGSLLLAGSVPPDDAFLVRRLRDAGAIILAKVNMSEFASGPTMSSIGGWIRNPHDVEHSPSGSSGGTGAAIAASFGQLGIGTDTGGSVRGPSTSNGIAGLKPTLGLVSRDGIIPLALSFDTGGPMARSVYDVAAMLNVIAASDRADPATAPADARRPVDYLASLDTAALAGARIGVARQFMGGDQEVDWIVESALETMEEAGATLVDVHLPQWLIDAKGVWYTTIRWREFRDQIPDYLATLAPGYPQTLEELVARSREVVAPTGDGGHPNPSRWSLFVDEEASGLLTDHEYVAMKEHGLPLVRTLLDGLMESRELDAIVYPTSPTRPSPVSGGGSGGNAPSATNLANLTGFPDLIVPAGFTSDGLPVGISFFGPA
ncbi:MAG: amidase family protein, partial [Longimicrobiales bacterium]|nr:amidase family protein [Longimicrobiales bacterium]